MSQKNFPKEQKKTEEQVSNQTHFFFLKFKYNFHPIDRNKQSLKRAKWVPRGGPPGPAKSGAHHHSPPRVRPPTNAPEPPHPVIPLVPATPISPRKKKKKFSEINKIKTAARGRERARARRYCGNATPGVPGGGGEARRPGGGRRDGGQRGVLRAVPAPPPPPHPQPHRRGRRPRRRLPRAPLRRNRHRRRLRSRSPLSFPSKKSTIF